MFKKLTYFSISIIFIYAFWFILGEKYVYKNDENGFSKLQCVSYAPYSKDQSPFDADYKLDENLVANDLKLLSQYTDCIRTYSSAGHDVVAKLARENNLKMYMGAWVSSDKESTKRELDELIKLASENKDLVKAVIVGNEVLLRHDANEEELAGYIKYVKDALPDIKVTYADVWEFWLMHPKIKESTDFVTIHILPYWENDPKDIQDAIEHVKNVRIEVADILGNDNILIGETGWPSEGRMREGAFPSKINQAKFVREFVSIANEHNWQYNIIEAVDQPWKRISEGAVGGYWGLFDMDRADKMVFKGDVSNFPNYEYLLAISVLLFIFYSSLLIKNKASRGQILKFNFFNILFALLMTLQLEQYYITTRTTLEHSWAIIVIFTHLAIYYYTLVYILKDSTKIIPRQLLYLSASLFLVSSFRLAFDGRYENFEIYVYTISALAFLYTYKGKIGQLNLSSYAKLISILLIISSIIILSIETIKNPFSNVWVIISVLFASILFVGSKKSSILGLKNLIIYIAILFAIFTILKYTVMLNNDVTGLVDSFKGYLGYLIYHKVFGIIAILFTILGLFRAKTSYYYIGIFFSVASIMLFNVFLGAVSFLIAINFLSKKL